MAQTADVNVHKEMNTIAEEESEEAEGITKRDELVRKESLSTVKMRNRVRSLGCGWVEYVTPSGRLYYYNSVTKQKSWKPPRRTEKSTTLPQNSFRSCDSRLSLPEYFNNLQDVESGNVGKILRTGMLKTKTLRGDKVTGKWVKSFVVLTELYVLFTIILGRFRKLFRKTKCPKPDRFFLLNAEVMKETTASNRQNVYRLKTEDKDILFRSKSSTNTEAWYQAFALVINNFKTQQNLPESRGFSEQKRSFDLKPSASLNIKKSISLSAFEDEKPTATSRIKCLSDFIGTKYPTPPGWITIFDSKSQKFCYVNSITEKKWFWSLTEDGHPYFYEEETGRRSCLLPSIYLDVNVQSLQEIKKSIQFRKASRNEGANSSGTVNASMS